MHRSKYRRTSPAFLALLAVLLTAGPASAADTLKIQQSGESPTVLDDLRQAGLEESVTLKDPMLAVLPAADRRQIDVAVKFFKHVITVARSKQSQAFESVPAQTIDDLIQGLRRQAIDPIELRPAWEGEAIHVLAQHHPALTDIKLTPQFVVRIEREARRRQLRMTQLFRPLYHQLDQLMSVLAQESAGAEIRQTIIRTLEEWSQVVHAGYAITLFDHIALLGESRANARAAGKAHALVTEFVDYLFAAPIRRCAFEFNRSIVEGFLNPAAPETQHTGVVYLLSGSGYLYAQALQMAAQSGADASRIHALYVNRAIADGDPVLLRTYVAQAQLSRYRTLVIVDTGFHGSSAKRLVGELDALPDSPEHIEIRLLRLADPPSTTGRVTIMGWNQLMEGWRGYVLPADDHATHFLAYALDVLLPKPWKSPTRLQRDPNGRISPVLIPTELPVTARIVEARLREGTQRWLGALSPHTQLRHQIWDLWLPRGGAEALRRQAGLEEPSQEVEQEWQALQHYRDLLVRHQGDVQGFDQAIQGYRTTRVPPARPEEYLSVSRAQRDIALKAAQFSSGGRLYHGMPNVNLLLRSGQLRVPASLTRVVDDASQAFLQGIRPGLLVIPTDYFNHLLRRRQATLSIEASTSLRVIHPYPDITTPVILSELLDAGAEIWVSEADYHAYEQIHRGVFSDAERDAGLQASLIQIFARGALRAVPGVSSQSDGLMLHEDITRILARYVLQRDLLVAIPIFERFQPDMEEPSRNPAVLREMLEAIRQEFPSARYGFGLDVRHPTTHLRPGTERVKYSTLDGQTFIREFPGVRLWRPTYAGSECLGYAVGLAKALNRRGYPVRLVQGRSAIWSEDMAVELMPDGPILSLVPGVQPIQGMFGGISNTGLTVVVNPHGHRWAISAAEAVLDESHREGYLITNRGIPMAWHELGPGQGLSVRAGIELVGVGGTLRYPVIRGLKFHLAWQVVEGATAGPSLKITVSVPPARLAELQARVLRSAPADVLDAAQQVPEVTVQMTRDPRWNPAFDRWMAREQDLLYYLTTKLDATWVTAHASAGLEEPRHVTIAKVVSAVQEQWRQFATHVAVLSSVAVEQPGSESHRALSELVEAARLMPSDEYRTALHNKVDGYEATVISQGQAYLAQAGHDARKLQRNLVVVSGPAQATLFPGDGASHQRVREIAKLLPIIVQTASGLEEVKHEPILERVGVFIVPALAGMASAVPADQLCRVFLWEGQPIPVNVHPSFVVHLGSRPTDYLQESRTFASAMRKQAAILWKRQGMTKIMLMRSAASRSLIGRQLPWSQLSVVEIPVDGRNLDEAMALLARESGWPREHAEASVRRVRQDLLQYGAML